MKDNKSVYEIVKQFVYNEYHGTSTGSWYGFNFSEEKSKRYLTYFTKTGHFKFWICALIDGVVIVNPHLQYECEIIEKITK